jgi:hypothetical protein
LTAVNPVRHESRITNNGSRPMLHRTTHAAAAALALAAAAAPAEPVACPDPLLAVEGTDPDTATRLCETAVAAKAHLAECGLVQTRPLTIEVTPEIDGPADHCAGLYICGSDRIRIIPPSAVADTIPAGSAFATIDAEAFHDSLVVHEMAHALMDRIDCAERRCAADLEYVAYAMQIGSLPPGEREALTGFREIRRPVDPARLNDFLLWMKPDLFALHAWAHFDDPGTGCAFVADLLSGEATLALPETLE